MLLTGELYSRGSKSLAAFSHCPTTRSISALTPSTILLITFLSITPSCQLNPRFKYPSQPVMTPIENTAPAIQALGDRIWEGVTALGFETLGRRSPETGAGIVSFRKPGVESSVIVRKLRDANIITAPRQGWVRCAPHFYIAPEEIDRMLSELSYG